MDSIPIPVIPLEYAPPEPAASRRVRWVTLGSLFLGAVTCFVGWLLIFVDTETVVVSGAVLFVAGAVLFGMSVRRRDRLAMTLGLAHCALIGLFVGLVNALRWGPQTATVPFLVMGGIYNAAISLPLSGAVFLRMRRTATTMSRSNDGA